MTYSGYARSRKNNRSALLGEIETASSEICPYFRRSTMQSMMKARHFYFFLLFALATGGLSMGCFSNLTKKTVVYFNDFEQDNLNGIQLLSTYGVETRRRTEMFNGSRVLGRFNNNAVILKLDSLPASEWVSVEFDLYIHDQWEGDHVRPGAGIPDIFHVSVNDQDALVTTFSNTAYKQSYPNWWPANIPSPPRGNALDTTLTGVCSMKGLPNGTSAYKFIKTFLYSGKSFKLDCRDALQPNDSLCLKSWSMDNLKITAITN